MPRRGSKKAAGVSIKCPGLSGPCPICNGITVTVTKKDKPVTDAGQEDKQEPKTEATEEQSRPIRYSPLNRRAAIAILAVMGHTVLIGAATWASAQALLTGGPYESGDFDGIDALYVIVLIAAAWAVIRWADRAQDNLEALESPPMTDRLGWEDWLLPGMNLVSPLFGMREISKKSNPVHNAPDGRGEALGSITPWGLLWATHIGVGWLTVICLMLLEVYTAYMGDWLTCVAGTAGVIAGLMLTHIIVTTSRQQERTAQSGKRPLAPMEPHRHDGEIKDDRSGTMKLPARKNPNPWKETRSLTGTGKGSRRKC